MTDTPKVILIVDDDPDIRLLLDFNLSAEGYDILEAANGADALEIIKTNNVNLVITDLTMPVMDGYELIKNLREISTTPRIPVLLLTGREEERLSTEGMANPPDDFIPKPFVAAELLKKVEKLMSDAA